MTELNVTGFGLDKINPGDIITIEGDYKPRAWWKFWLWGKPRVLQQYKAVGIVEKSGVAEISLIE